MFKRNQKLFKHKLYNAMGVLNVTPDSFSDGNSHKNSKELIKHYQEIMSWAQIIDIGAESTAPFNNAISNIEELTRLEFCFNSLKTTDAPKTVSIDTYKPEIMYEAYFMAKTIWPKTQIIWNDISGCVDNEGIDLLSELSDLHYVLCHNFAPNRMEANNHMDYCLEHFNIFPEVVRFFKERIAFMSKRVKNRVYLDLCFGFSKSAEQNLRLLSRMNSFLNEFSGYEHIIGLSRKSFLRFNPIISSKGFENQAHLDHLLAKLMYDMNLNGPQFTHRLHDQRTLLMLDHLHELDNVLP